MQHGNVFCFSSGTIRIPANLDANFCDAPAEREPPTALNRVSSLDSDVDFIRPVLGISNSSSSADLVNGEHW